MKIHLIDGTYELFRQHFGVPSRQDGDGVEIGATLGVLRTLTSLLRQQDVTHVGVAFDHVIESFRNDLFDGYKTGEGIEAELRNQFELAEAAAHALGVVVWPMVEFEADDALAAAAARFADAAGVDQVVIGTPDKDLAQCVRGERVVLLDRRRDNHIIDEAGVLAKWGVAPASIPDWLALVGDTADGIPGLPKWGAKGSSTVLARWGHIDAIPEDPEAWDVKVRGAKGLAAVLNERRDDALLYRQLATLRTDVPLDENLDGMAWRGARRAPLAELCARVGDPGLVERVPRFRDD